MVQNALAKFPKTSQTNERGAWEGGENQHYIKLTIYLGIVEITIEQLKSTYENGFYTEFKRT